MDAAKNLPEPRSTIEVERPAYPGTYPGLFENDSQSHVYAGNMATNLVENDSQVAAGLPTMRQMRMIRKLSRVTDLRGLSVPNYTE